MSFFGLFDQYKPANFFAGPVLEFAEARSSIVGQRWSCCPTYVANLTYILYLIF